jgi:hypothetical protein
LYVAPLDRALLSLPFLTRRPL